MEAKDVSKRNSRHRVGEYFYEPMEGVHMVHQGGQKEIFPGLRLYTGAFDFGDDWLDWLLDVEWWQPSMVGEDGKSEGDLRNSMGFRLDGAAKINSIAAEMDRTAYHIIDPLLTEYCIDYELAGWRWTDEGYNLLLYEEGGFYARHCDNFGKGHHGRQISMVSFINDDYEGGQLHFPQIKVTLEPKKGDVAFFPSNWLFQHEALKVTKGTKISLVSWYQASMWEGE